MEHNLGNTPVQEERPGRMLIRPPAVGPPYRRPYADDPLPGIGSAAAAFVGNGHWHVPAPATPHRLAAGSLMLGSGREGH